MTCGTHNLVRFAEKQGLSLDWLLYGRLHGLLRQARGSYDDVAPPWPRQPLQEPPGGAA